MRTVIAGGRNYVMTREDFEMKEIPIVSGSLTTLVEYVHCANFKWWHDIDNGEPITRNKGELIALLHSELSEMLEGVRKDTMDDHLPHRKTEEVEAADVLIRLLDYCGGMGLDLEGAFYEKMDYNRTRADHSNEERRKAHGKKF